MTLADRREELRKEFMNRFGPVPERPPLGVRVLSKRKRFGYDEWRIEYTAESTDTMPEPAGRTIPAYLLIPTGKQQVDSPPPREDHAVTPPFPAMVCFHQCGIDCDIGKEAVVGKVVDRPDQAYGLELVRSGVVVLAPDSINCGERNVPSQRQQGECKHCGHPPRMDGALGCKPDDKQLSDAVRALDLLESLDFVDSRRIGAVGHSYGSWLTFVTMAYDQRITAGIASGGMGDGRKYLPTLAPRLFMFLAGSYDHSPDELAKDQEAYDRAHRHYVELGAPDNLVLRVQPCEHHFADEFKWEAYARLREYFGLVPPTERVSLKDVLAAAIKNSAGWWHGEKPWRWEKDQTPELTCDPELRVVANRDTLVRAFEAILYPLSEKIPADSTLTVRAEAEADSVRVVYSVPAGTDETRAPMDYLTRQAEQLFVENKATLTRHSNAAGLEYVVTLKLSHVDSERETSQQPSPGDAGDRAPHP